MIQIKFVTQSSPVFLILGILKDVFHTFSNLLSPSTYVKKNPPPPGGDGVSHFLKHCFSNLTQFYVFISSAICFKEFNNSTFFLTQHI